MRKLLKVLSIALLFPALLVGQQATLNSAQPNQAPISATAITLLPTVQPPVPSGSVARLGNPGQRTFYYWVVASGSFLSSAPAGPFELDQAPNLYGTGIGAQISWAPSVGALAYDVLRTTTPVPPSGACNCAVATLLYGATSYTDTNGSLSAYTVASVDPAAYAVQMTNQGGSLSLSNPFSAPSISSPSITTTGSEYFYRQGYLSNPTTDGQLMYRSSGLAPTGYGRWVYYSARLSGSGVRTLVPAEDVYGDGMMNPAGYFQNTGLNGYPYCAGFSPADTQAITWSNIGSCWQSANVGSSTSGLSDWTNSGAANGSMPTWNSSTGKWTPSPASATVSLYNCGSATSCTTSAVTQPRIEITGSLAAVSTGTTVTFPISFTSTTTYLCVASEQSSSGSDVKVAIASASSITLTPGVSSTVNYICMGY